MRPTLLVTVALALATLAGCTWVKMAPGADQVRVARASEDLSACTRRGEVAVSVKDRLGPLGRNEIKVRDELEVLARNEAPGLGADTVQPRGEPDDGEQRFGAYSCGGRVVGRAPAAGRDRPREDGAAEVIPLED
ncbi:DUF4156 domain-containing protein [Arenimonas composti]|uniref:DUF4156 domain-containing protein n=1 Tax=Arenimonas composti TR7-09 = DSM 18010 TaxID=1121013 RepID=A0A091C1V8_9GAMM|nr:DUF4156 domain-containing protein [Arenimonas composti]KFN50625.1 hypothetical protein P873_05550 [Arenimonas composti TR7-09 = DSM 18010]